MNRIFSCLPALMLIAAVFSGCQSHNREFRENNYSHASFRDVPGVTEEEIRSIEALQKQHPFFSFGMMPSAEVFIDDNGEIKGFTALFCEWLSGLFGIPFSPAIYSWGDLLDGLD